MSFILNISILSYLIYQSLAGAPIPQLPTTTSQPTSTNAPLCVRCGNILSLAIPPSPINCDPGATQKIMIRVFYKDGSPEASGACTDVNAGITQTQFDSNILAYLVDIRLQFLSSSG
ncbi:hypothetical protein ACKWTF_014876 [Chironomus riparius]